MGDLRGTPTGFASPPTGWSPMQYRRCPDCGEPVILARNDDTRDGYHERAFGYDQQPHRCGDDRETDDGEA